MHMEPRSHPWFRLQTFLGLIIGIYNTYSRPTMRLTSFTDYGLRILMRLAGEPERGFSTAELADFFDLSRHHLTKIVQTLTRAGYLTTRRGAGGGARLARPATDIRLGTVIRLLERDQPLVDCFSPGGGTCTLDGRCGLKARLRHAEAAFLADMDRATLADVALVQA